MLTHTDESEESLKFVKQNGREKAPAFFLTYCNNKIRVKKNGTSKRWGRGEGGHIGSLHIQTSSSIPPGLLVLEPKESGVYYHVTQLIGLH
jgi:hypothetical protein